MKNNKLTFFEWCAEQEALEGEDLNGWTEHYKDFATKHAWHSYQSDKAVHDGDCTKCPYTCQLCVLEDLLADYRQYYFSNDE